jgi:hypothetical protein
MAVPSDTFETFDAKGNREDLLDVIYNVSPTDTPFTTGVPVENAQAVLHEWQTDSLADAAANAVAEGDDATTDAAAATTRLSNTCQIMDKVARVSGTQETVKKGGRVSEMDYQIAKRSLELLRDLEFNVVGVNNAEVTGSSGTARELGSITAWITTNTSNGTSGSDGSLGNTARTDGTDRAFTESLLQAVLQSCFTNGGDPDCIMVGAFNKRAVSGFSGNATRDVGAEHGRLHSAISYFESDWGMLEIVPNRFMRAGDALVIQKDMWAIAYLRQFRLYDLAKTGDSERKQLLLEATLESRNEAASGAVWDISES